MVQAYINILQTQEVGKWENEVSPSPGSQSSDFLSELDSEILWLPETVCWWMTDFVIDTKHLFRQNL